jgi:hypothetical protein
MSLGDAGKTVKTPPVPPPEAIPDKTPEAEGFARRRIPRGRQETFLTGNLIPETGKKKVLG